MSELEGAPPHVASEFLLWLWFRSEAGRGRVRIGDEDVDFWMDDRLALRPPGEDRVAAVLTGENPSVAPEARAALAGGKVVRDLRLALRRADREYTVTLRGASLEIVQAKLPAQVKSGAIDEQIYERMYLYEELHVLVSGLFRAFAEERCAPDWRARTLTDLRAWAASGVGA